MGTVLQFRPSLKTAHAAANPFDGLAGEIIIFPGVRMERHDLDLSHRVRDSAGRDNFDGIGGGRPRKSS